MMMMRREFQEWNSIKNMALLIAKQINFNSRLHVHSLKRFAKKCIADKKNIYDDHKPTDIECVMQSTKKVCYEISMERF